jgi:hypothetical protein
MHPATTKTCFLQSLSHGQLAFNNLQDDQFCPKCLFPHFFSHILPAEDDILWVSEDLDAKIHQVISKLPDGWHLCYLGWHGQSVLHLALGPLGDVDCLEAAVELEDVFLAAENPT